MPANLQASYAAKHASVIELLEALKEKINDLPSPETDSLTWADHGDLCRLERDLEAIAEYLP